MESNPFILTLGRLVAQKKQVASVISGNSMAISKNRGSPKCQKNPQLLETLSPRTLTPQALSLVRPYILLVPLKRDPREFWVMRSERVEAETAKARKSLE